MAGKLITLPLRVSFGSAQLLTRVAAGATGRALSLLGRTIGAVAPARPQPAPAAPPQPAPAAPPRERRATPVRQYAPPAPPEPPTVEESEAPPSGAAERTPVHVSEEPELVREEAEPGAEDGAGAAITVMEPWNGYARMSAKDVIARARRSDPAELAAVRLYESRHRSRQTVLAAVDRELKLSNGGAPA